MNGQAVRSLGLVTRLNRYLEMRSRAKKTPDQLRNHYLRKADEAHTNADKALDASVRQTWHNVERTWQFLADQVKRTSHLGHH